MQTGKRPQFQSNTKALEGLPLQLLITVIIIAIAAPLSWSYFSIYDSEQTEANLLRELDIFMVRAKQVYTAGEGNIDTFRLEIRDGAVTSVEYVEIGNSLAEHLFQSSEVHYRLSGQSGRHLSIRDPFVPLNSTADGVLQLKAGTHTLRLECRLSELDLDGDGARDLYVQVSRV